MTVTQSSATQMSFPESGIGHYVTELQLHMSLQAKNLVPSFPPTSEGVRQLLHESQTNLEKLASRQMA